MKTSLIIILAGFFLSISWISYLGFSYLGFDAGGEVMVDGITVNAVIVTVLSVVFSIASWFLFSWASKSINSKGIMLSVITGVVLITPFNGDLGPMAAVMVGVAAGFVAYMIQKKITSPATNKPLVIGAVTIAASYAILFALIVSVQTTTHIWDTGNGDGDSCPVIHFLGYAWEDCGSIFTWSILGIPFLMIIVSPIGIGLAIVFWRIRK